MLYYYIILLLMILNIGCSSTSGEKLVRGGRYVIIQEEIERSGMGMTTAYDVIRFLRPTLMPCTMQLNRLHQRRILDSWVDYFQARKAEQGGASV